jgi:hypothetical protein
MNHFLILLIGLVIGSLFSSFMLAVFIGAKELKEAKEYVKDQEEEIK